VLKLLQTFRAPLKLGRIKRGSADHFEEWNLHVVRNGHRHADDTRPIAPGGPAAVTPSTHAHRPAPASHVGRCSDKIGRAFSRSLRRRRRSPRSCDGFPARARCYPTASHVFCALCDCRLEGSYQRAKHWMRCQYVQRRGNAAAEATGHPKSLQVKEQVLLDAMLDFLSRRVFAPDRVALLRDEIFGAANPQRSANELVRHRDLSSGHMGSRTEPQLVAALFRDPAFRASIVGAVDRRFSVRATTVFVHQRPMVRFPCDRSVRTGRCSRRLPRAPAPRSGAKAGPPVPGEEVERERGWVRPLCP
jgi:hypothetical protein